MFVEFEKMGFDVRCSLVRRQSAMQDMNQGRHANKRTHLRQGAREMVVVVPGGGCATKPAEPLPSGVYKSTKFQLDDNKDLTRPSQQLSLSE